MKIAETSFKSDLVFQRFDECQIVLKLLAEAMYSWCMANKYPFFITASKSTEAEDRVLNRVSKTHEQGRAFDLSIRGWTPEMIENFIKYFSAKYESIAAVNMAGEKRLIFHHDNGNGDHLHVQIRPGLSEENFSKV